MLSRDKRLPLDTWNAAGLPQNVFFVINFLHLVCPEILFKEFILVSHTKRKETESVPRTVETGTVFFARDDEQNKGTISMPTFAKKPLTMSSSIPVEIPQNPMVGQQRQQISALQFDKLPNPQSFLVWKIPFPKQVTTCSDFASDTVLWINEVAMVDALDESKSSR